MFVGPTDIEGAAIFANQNNRLAGEDGGFEHLLLNAGQARRARR
jgi:hypothetical protein